MSRIYIGIILILLLSCQVQKSPSLKSILADQCFWDIVDDNQVRVGVNSGYRFLSNGNCFFYYYKFSRRKRTDSVYRYETTDVLFPNIWTSTDDTLLNIRGFEFRIISLTADSISVINKRSGDKLLLHKNCKTIY